MVIAGFVDNVVTACRSTPQTDFADPAVRSLPGAAERLDALTARAAAALFGPHPSVDQRAGLALMLDLKPVLRALDELPDDELRQALLRLCQRLAA